jgi:hypothetical protein
MKGPGLAPAHVQYAVGEKAGQPHGQQGIRLPLPRLVIGFNSSINITCCTFPIHVPAIRNPLPAAPVRIDCSMANVTREVAYNLTGGMTGAPPCTTASRNRRTSCFCPLSWFSSLYARHHAPRRHRKPCRLLDAIGACGRASWNLFTGSGNHQKSPRR